MANQETETVSTNSLHVATRLSPDLRSRALVVAREKDWSLSQLIRNALLEYITRHGAKAA